MATTAKPPRILARIGVALDWPVVAKVRLIAVMSCLALAFQFAFRAIFFAQDTISPHIDWSVEYLLRKCEIAAVVGWVLIAIAGRFIGDSERGQHLYEFLAVQFFAASFSALGYAIGSLSFAAGIFVAGAPFIGFVLLRASTVLAGLATAAVVMGSLSIATATGRVPYAPVYFDPAIGQDTVLGWRVLADVALGLPFLLMAIVVASVLIARWRERERGIAMLSVTDPLTGAHNRRYAMQAISDEFQASQTKKHPFSLILVDLDHFKRVNDKYGHLGGDRALVAAADALRAVVRSSDMVARFGGEEFIILLRRPSPQIAMDVAERGRQAIESLELHAPNGKPFHISASFGAGSYQPPEPLEEFIKRVDDALYAAKDGGRNRVVEIQQI